MHAFLIVAKNSEQLDINVSKILKDTNSKLMVFELQKIDDAKQLKAFVKFSFSEKTCILIKNFHKATEESVNAILKILEEPPENLNLILHSVSENSVYPTIKSRCQIIYSVPSSDTFDNAEIESFVKMNANEKIEYFAKFKIRDEAIIFSENLLKHYNSLISKLGSSEISVKDIQAVLKLNKSLNLNGNLNIQFLRYLCNISN